MAASDNSKFCVKNCSLENSIFLLPIHFKMQCVDGEVFTSLCKENKSGSKRNQLAFMGPGFSGISDRKNDETMDQINSKVEGRCVA